MDSRKLNDWLQIIGLFGLIGGLAFVGLQLSLDRQVAIANGIQNSIATGHQWAELLGGNSDVWVKGLAGGPLSDNERVTFNALAMARQNRYFDRYDRAIRGIGGNPPEIWVFEFAHEMSSNPGFVNWWRETRALRQGWRERIGLLSQSTWDAAVTEELERLEGNQSTQ